MLRKLMIALMTLALMLTFVLAFAQEDKPKGEEKAVKHEYVGDKKCKICHKKDNIHASWMETKHAKAWESLDEEAQKKEECIGCHSTGKLPEGELLTGVQCEACHGPGSDYKKMSIMKDQEKAIANGLLIPTVETCKGCHNEKVPEEFRPKEPYDFAAMMKTGLHDMPYSAEKKKEETKEEGK